MVTQQSSLPPHKRKCRDRILAAAIELVDEGGSYESIQVRDVADRADLALATLYRYFPSKEILYAAALVQWSSEFFQRAGSPGAKVLRTRSDFARSSAARRALSSGGRR